MAEILKAIVDDAVRNPTLSNIRLASACLLAYAGFLRVDELIKLRSCDIFYGWRQYGSSNCKQQD